MTKIKILILSMLAAVAVAPAAFAEEPVVTMMAGDDTAGYLVDDSECERFLSDDEVSVDCDTDKSVFLSGNIVRSEASSNGLFAVGNNIIVRGEHEFGFLAGNSVTIDGTYRNDVFMAGNIVTISKDAVIERDIYIAGSTVEINADVAGDVYVTASTVKISGINIAGNLKISANTIEFQNGTTVGGVVEYNNDATVAGLYGLTAPEISTYEPISVSYNNRGIWGRILGGAISFLCGALILIVATFLFPKFFKSLSAVAKKYEPKQFGIDFILGIIVLICTPVVAVLTMLTIVGIPLALISMLFYALFLYAGTMATGALAGRCIIKSEKVHPMIYAVVGYAILKVLFLIPFASPIIAFLSLTTGMGIIIRTIRNKK